MQGMVLFQSLFFVSEIYGLLSNIFFRVMYKELYLTNTNTTLALSLIRLNVACHHYACMMRELTSHLFHGD